MTWHDLTFTSSHVLTASDMNGVMENFTALAEGHAGAPPVFPAGTVIAYAGTAAPPGWLPCDGSPVSRDTYSALFAAIGETFGAGDGGGTFNLPDLRGRGVVGTGTGTGGGTSGTGLPAGGDPLSARSLADWFGEEEHTLSVGEMPRHNHEQQRDNGSGGTAYRLTDNGGALSATDTAPDEMAGGDGPHNTIQPSLVLAYMIKT